MRELQKEYEQYVIWFMENCEGNPLGFNDWLEEQEEIKKDY